MGASRKNMHFLRIQVYASLDRGQQDYTKSVKFVSHLTHIEHVCEYSCIKSWECPCSLLVFFVTLRDLL